MMGFVPQVGTLQLLIVLVIAVLVLGPKRIPEAAKSVGQGIRGFRKTMDFDDDSDDDVDKTELKQTKTKTKAKTKAKAKAKTEV